MLHLITVCVQSLVKEVSVVSSSRATVFVDANRIFAFAAVNSPTIQFPYYIILC